MYKLNCFITKNKSVQDIYSNYVRGYSIFHISRPSDRLQRGPRRPFGRKGDFMPSCPTIIGGR
jgi:hypothetical protein